jgi:uncharacterized membrane protein YphA (DoxX/SURF4 family)
VEIVGVGAAIVVGASLIAAAVLKLAHAPAWRAQAADLGVAAPVAVALPWVELVVGAALVVPVVRPWPALAACVLLGAFTVVVVRRLGDGSRPPCGCFGSRSRRPLGPAHVARNAAMLALAVVAAAWG